MGSVISYITKFKFNTHCKKCKTYMIDNPTNESLCVNCKYPIYLTSVVCDDFVRYEYQGEQNT